MAVYEVLKDGTIVHKAGKNIGNLDCLRTKILWTNPNPTSSFASQTITLNSSDYDYIILIYNRGSNIIEKGKSITLNYEALGWTSSQNDTIRLISRSFTYIDDVTYSVSQADGKYWNNGIKLSQSENNELIPYKIIGFYEQPSMIYTGKELFAGNGINIDDGVISNAPALMQYKMTSELRLSTAGSTFKLPCTTAISSSSVSGKLIAQSDGSIKIGSGVSLVRVSANFQLYLNTITSFWCYILKNGSSQRYLIEQMKDSSYRNIPMTLCPILIQVVEGDIISIAVQSTAGTNNGVQHADYLVEVIE